VGGGRSSGNVARDIERDIGSPEGSRKPGGIGSRSVSEGEVFGKKDLPHAAETLMMNREKEVSVWRHPLRAPVSLCALTLRLGDRGPEKS